MSQPIKPGIKLQIKRGCHKRAICKKKNALQKVSWFKKIVRKIFHQKPDHSPPHLNKLQIFLCFPDPEFTVISSWFENEKECRGRITVRIKDENENVYDINECFLMKKNSS